AAAARRAPPQPHAEEPVPGSRRAALGARAHAAAILRRGPGVGAGAGRGCQVPQRGARARDRAELAAFAFLAANASRAARASALAAASCTWSCAMWLAACAPMPA